MNKGKNMKYMTGQILFGGQVIDEHFIFQKPTTFFVPLKKQITKKVNNCRTLEFKVKRK